MQLLLWLYFIPGLIVFAYQFPEIEAGLTDVYDAWDFAFTPILNLIMAIVAVGRLFEQLGNR